MATGRFTEEALQREAADSGSAKAWNNLATLQADDGRLKEAALNYKRAIQIEPRYALAHKNLGFTLHEQGLYREAELHLRTAIELRSPYPEARLDLGNTLVALGYYQAAAQMFESAIEENPNYAEAWFNLGTALIRFGMIEDAVRCLRTAVSLKPGDRGPYSNLLMALHYSANSTDAEIQAALAAFGALDAGKPTVMPPIDFNPERRLRLGLLSGNFVRHPVGIFAEAALRALDRKNFEVACYSVSPATDEVSARLHAAADRWVDIPARVSDEGAARIIANDRIDILIELSGHSKGGRLGILGYRPAPVQAALAGHFCSTGLPSVDYFICDSVEVPAGHEYLYTESPLRLAQTRICYTPPEDAPPVSELPALRDGVVTFGCFNNPAKVREPTLALWADILKAVPGSRLVFRYSGFDGAEVSGFINERLAAKAIALERVTFHGSTPQREMLQAYGDVDIALDPFPYGGGLSTCEALWMGVPVISLPQRRFCGRTTASHLSNAGLADWIASTEGDYVALAARWSTGLPRLAALRRGLRGRTAASRLCDGAAYGRDLGDALREAWRRRVTSSR